jgi:hypothetical protein
MNYWEYAIRSLVNTASVSVGIGKIQLCHYNLVWYNIHLVLNSTLYIFVSRKGCPSVVEILSRPFSQICGVRPFIHANSEGCRGRNTIRPPRLAGFDPSFVGDHRKVTSQSCVLSMPSSMHVKESLCILFYYGSQNVLEYSSTGNEVNGRFILGYSWTIQCLKKLY